MKRGASQNGLHSISWRQFGISFTYEVQSSVLDLISKIQEDLEESLLPIKVDVFNVIDLAESYFLTMPSAFFCLNPSLGRCRDRGHQIFWRLFSLP